MNLLQCTGGLALDDVIDAARTSQSEIDRLFDCSIDTYSPDGLTLLFQKASKLAMRLDSCFSQILGFAITTVRMTLLLASQGLILAKAVNK